MVLNDWLIQMLQTQYPREMAHTAGLESCEASMCTADWTRPEVTSDTNPPPAFLHALCSASEDEEEVAREMIACRYGFMLEIIPTAGIKGVLQRYFLL